MKTLIRLYPRAWRERYGEELSLLLEDRPPGPFDALDLLLGALDAHLHAVGGRGAAPTSTPRAARLGAGAAIAGGALWMLALATAVRDDPAMTSLVMLLISLTLSMFVVALAALSAVQIEVPPDARAGRASCCPRSASRCSLGGSVAEVVVGDRPLRRDLNALRVLDRRGRLRAHGITAVGIISTVAGGLTRWTAVLLSAGALVQLITIVATDHARDGWLMLVGAVAFGLSWVLVGVGAARRTRSETSIQTA